MAASRPYSVAYDPNSGNVIAAMGTMGITVGAPDGSWTPVAVGPYAPVDFSILGKVRTLLSEPNFWATILALPLSVVAATLFPRLWKTDSGGGDLSIALLVFTSMVMSIVLLGWTGSADFDNSSSSVVRGLGTVLLCVVSILFAGPAIAAALTGEQRIPLRPVVLGYVAMAGLVALSFFAWQLVDWSFILFAFVTVVLCIVAAVVLGRHVHLILPARERRGVRP